MKRQLETGERGRDRKKREKAGTPGLEIRSAARKPRLENRVPRGRSGWSTLRCRFALK
jgi:hypothetical protein